MGLDCCNISMRTYRPFIKISRCTPNALRNSCYQGNLERTTETPANFEKLNPIFETARSVQLSQFVKLVSL